MGEGDRFCEDYWGKWQNVDALEVSMSDFSCSHCIVTGALFRGFDTSLNMRRVPCFPLFLSVPFRRRGLS